MALDEMNKLMVVIFSNFANGLFRILRVVRDGGEQNVEFFPAAPQQGRGNDSRDVVFAISN
jgi:hypothetical protein